MRTCVMGLLVASLLVVGPPSVEGQTPAADAAEPLDAVDLPVSLERIKRRMDRLPESRAERSLLRLDYYIDVYGRAPRIRVMEGFDVHTGPVPYGSPTHSEMLSAMTPRQWQPPVANVSGVVGWALRGSMNAPR